MKMLPEIIFSTPSKAEHRVFSLLQDSETFSGATCLHSLNCSEHAYKQWSEIDFCIASRQGIFILEVKGGSVSVSDGLWHYRGAKSEGTSSEGPFIQAKTARFALENMLKERYRLKRELANWPVFGFGVVLVDTPWNTHSPEMPREIVADREDCRNAASFNRYLDRLATYWRKKKPNPATLVKADVQKIRQTLRPNVDFFPPFTLRMGQALDQLQHMTEDQYQFLEWVEPNDQIIVTGGAGTGKTFLAVQCARMELERGRSAAVMVESPTLAAHIRRMEPRADLKVLTVDQAKRLSGKEKFDVVLVDEGQDLLSLESLSLVSSLIKGGLEEGRWRWFMDYNRQAHLRGEFDPSALDALREGFGSSKPFSARLSTNVRNTREIISKVESWTKAELGVTKYTGHGSAPILVVADDLGGLISALRDLIEDYARREIPMEDIGIVVSERLGEKDFIALEKAFRKNMLRLGPTTVSASLKGKAVMGNASDFKGLERPIIFAVGFDLGGQSEYDLNELYVATTRGNYGLVVIGTKRLIDSLKAN